MNFVDHLEGLGMLAAFCVYLFIEIKKKIALKKHTVEESVIVNERIFPILWRTLIEYRAIRLYVAQFHNGDIFYTGQSIQRNTITHEVYLKGVQSIKATVDNQMISNVMHQTVREIREDGHWGFDDINEIDIGMATDELFENATINGVKAAHFFRITDKHDKTVGVLIFHWNFKYALDIMAINKIKAEVKILENIFEDAR